MKKPPIQNRTRLKPMIKFILVSTSFCAITLSFSVLLLAATKIVNKVDQSPLHFSDPTTLNHLVFAIASSGKSWPRRNEYTKLWWNHNNGMRGCVFVDNLPDNDTNSNSNSSSLLPPLCVSEDTSKFRYTYHRPGGLRSAIRVARVVKEIVALNHSDVRWYVFGDDDTVFLSENLVKILSKYDHRLWYYVGANTEMYEQAQYFGFGMAFGGGGFAISAPLAKVLAKVFDSCIERYHHLYGSDSRVYSCISELGISLTHEPGFHQVDLRGNIFGLLAAHPLTPLISLHHPETTDPIFPNMTQIRAYQHLFEAVEFDSQRVLQQTVCYDNRYSWTVSVSWGYTVQVFHNNMPLPEALKVLKTFRQWKKGKSSAIAGLFNLNTREVDPDPCKRPSVFYLDKVSYGNNKDFIISSYKKSFQNCSHDMPTMKLEVIKVVTNKLDLDIKQLQSPRRHCCDVLPSRTGDMMEVAIRECKDEELIYMH
ncbi:hypothetical protein PIB30_074823 [Stylosanthes scabra]|uniref:Transferring glycosyl group transferase n=1 Tax=Stylosanthes scabra TaxID=79078 RepID=A0ABU6QQ74_9FABA|nr:hypothetical protein [Stylosanthes scabra]